MPTVVSESDLFPQTFQRPNNGELADAASLLLPLQQIANRQRWNYNRTRGAMYDATRAPYLADLTGATNAAVATQAAIDAAATAGGGDVYAPPGAFRFDNGITVPRTVSLFGHPNGTVFLLNHATADFVTFTTGTNAGACSVISGIGFGGSVVNTGNVFTDAGSGSRRVLIYNCTVGDDDANLTGHILSLTGSSVVACVDSELHVSGATSGLLVNHAGAVLGISGGRIVCPATYASTLVYYSLGSGSVRTFFDFTAHTSGVGATAVAVSSGPSTPIEIVGSRFVGAGGPTKYALSADSGTNVRCEANSYYGVNRFNSVGLLLAGSNLDLYPDANVSLVGSAYTVSTGVRSTLIRFGVGSTAPTITLPPILFAGQELDLTIYNASGGTLGLGLANYGVKSAMPTLSNANGASGRFVAADWQVIGTLEWVQIGDWGTVAA